ncbi:MAG: peptide chain release factor 3 [Chrysiogenales bacterium]|nr:MAG: peptide chain release factor 3 [Chrysiogenales bacterium]
MIRKEISRRRTFAIISHPDAGKTTLTEKLLLYGGALDLAGSVTAKKKQRETSSDWMELEKKRGISISSTVLQFEYGGYRLNLLDTPGHRDFSEDTYRVLTAVDGVIMVIDAGKGIESQTRKLFEICRKRGIPIFTYMNKLDRPSLPPLDLLDQLEKVLGLHAFPVNWPLDNGPLFKGVYDRLGKMVHLFERVPGGAYRAPVSVHDISDPLVRSLLNDSVYEEIMDELEILDGAHGGFDSEEVLKGKTTPVFFGSAANNFGVELLLKGFLEQSGGPAPRESSGGPVPLDHPAFSGFVFKVQTNMNPMHRDRMVFARVCSGRFVRDMSVFHSRLKKEVRISSAHNVFGRDRETLSEAYAGDILGFVTNTQFRVGDTITSDPSIEFEEITRFAPECFAYLNAAGGSSYKTFRKGIEQLLAEDIVQTFHLNDSTRVLPLLGAVGPLQFEVLQYRLREEYGVESNLEMMPWTTLRWIETPPEGLDILESLPHGAVTGVDESGRPVVLFTTEWSRDYFADKFPSVQLLDSPIKFPLPISCGSLR